MTMSMPGTAPGRRTSSLESDLESLKKQLVTVEKEEKVNRQKLERLLNLYLEGNLPQASYVVKSSELEVEAERLSQAKSELQYQIQSHGNHNVSADLINTIRILSRSHRRFTEEEKVRVFRSLIKQTRITASGVELEMYAQPDAERLVEISAESYSKKNCDIRPNGSSRPSSVHREEMSRSRSLVAKGGKNPRRQDRRKPAHLYGYIRSSHNKVASLQRDRFVNAAHIGVRIEPKNDFPWGSTIALIRRRSIGGEVKCTIAGAHRQTRQTRSVAHPGTSQIPAVPE